MAILRFSKWRPSAILDFKILQFLSCSPCRHAILLPHTKFLWNLTIGWWVMTKKRFSRWRPIVTNFCTGVGVHNVITSANFYDCRLWGLSVVRNQILGFSINLHRRPYNTLALPCECVMANQTDLTGCRTTANIVTNWMTGCSTTATQTDLTGRRTAANIVTSWPDRQYNHGHTN